MKHHREECRLTVAEINHLRRLLGWADGEVGQTPEEMIETVRGLAHVIGPGMTEQAKERLAEDYQRAVRMPKYIRAAIKALRKTIKTHDGSTVDAEWCEERRLVAPNGVHISLPLEKASP